MRSQLTLCVAAIVVTGTAAIAQAQVPVAPQTQPGRAMVAPVAPPAPSVPVLPAVPPPPTPPQATPPPSPAPPAPAQTPRPPRAVELTGNNVRVEVTLVDQSATGAPTRKSISLTTAEGVRGSVRSGVTIPVPTTTFGPAPGVGAPNTQPVTSFQYRDVGLSLDVQDVAVVGSLIRLRVAVEYNPVDAKTASQEGLVPTSSSVPPSFARFTQSLQLVLHDGQSLTVAQSSDPVPGRNGTASLEIKATIVKAGTGK